MFIFSNNNIYLCQVNEVNGGDIVLIGLCVCVCTVNRSIRQLAR